MSDTEAKSIEESGLIVTEATELQKTDPAGKAAEKELADQVKAAKWSRPDHRRDQEDRPPPPAKTTARKTATASAK